MALSLDRLREAVEVFNQQTPELQARWLQAEEIARAALQTSVPAVCEADQAAFAYHVGGMLAYLREEPIRSVSDIVNNTAIGYTLVAARLLGMMA